MTSLSSNINYIVKGHTGVTGHQITISPKKTTLKPIKEKFAPNALSDFCGWNLSIYENIPLYPSEYSKRCR